MLRREPLDGAGKRSPGWSRGDLARSVTWRAFIPASVFRYRGRSRRSQGSLPQHVFRLVYAIRSDKVLPERVQPRCDGGRSTLTTAGEFTFERSDELLPYVWGNRNARFDSGMQEQWRMVH